MKKNNPMKRRRFLAGAGLAAAGATVVAAAEGVRWQFAPERVGHVRRVRLHMEPLRAGEPGTPESAAEQELREGERVAAGEVTLETLSASEPGWDGA